MFSKVKGANDLEMVAQVPLHLDSCSSVPVTHLHMMEDKISVSSRLEILYCCGNNELAIYFEPVLLPGLLSVYCPEIFPVLLTWHRLCF